MDDVTPIPAEDAVELVFTLVSVTRIPALAKAMEFSPVVPAPGLLADVPANRPLVSKLRACHFRGGLGQGGIALPENFVIFNFGNRGQGADPESAVTCLADTSEGFELPDAHQLFSAKDIIPKAAQEVGSTGMDSRPFG
jgi:hypothetical protein